MVIGYGNTLRGDDGVGPRVAEAVAALALPGVRTLVCAQLSPEHADPVAQARTVIFVDAAVNAPREVQLRELEPADTSPRMAYVPPTHARCWPWPAMFSAAHPRRGC